MPRKAKRQKKSLDEYQIPGTQRIIKPGDSVMMRPPDPNTSSYIARIEKIECDSSDRVTLRCRWYYRPEESLGGRRQFHGAKELFLSDHYDTCSPEAIEGSCVVYSFKEYTRLEIVQAEDFYCRFEYNASTGSFNPDRVAVYCLCEMPYNPDDLMIQCESCKDWFHPACVKVKVEDIKNLRYFYCPGCTQP